MMTILLVMMLRTERGKLQPISLPSPPGHREEG
jgi:hypothetical protein